MKTRLLPLLIVLLYLGKLSAQTGVSINTTNATADPSAILDVSSSTQGVLIPKMTSLEKKFHFFSSDGLAGL